MYKNIGKKIKTLAKVTAWLGVIYSVIGGFGFLVNPVDRADVFIGISAMILGPIASWLGSLVLYGFGQLVDNSDRLADKLAPDVQPEAPKAAAPVAQKTGPAESGDTVRLCSRCGRVLVEDACPFCGHVEDDGDLF